MNIHPRLIFLAGPKKGETFLIPDSDVTIGRHSSNLLTWDDDKLFSRYHCQLVRGNDEFILTDLGSRNGTFVNGIPITQVTLGHQDTIKIGNSLALFLIHEEGEDDSASALVGISDDDPNSQSTIFLSSADSHYLNATKPMVDPTTAIRMSKNLQALLQLGQEIHSIRDMNALQQRLLELIFTAIPAERGAILLFGDEDNFVSRVIRFRSENTAEKEQQMTISRSILQRAKQADGGILAIRVENDLSLQQALSLQSSGAHSVMAARLANSSEVFGLIYLDTTNPGQSFDEEHLQLLITIANLAAGALETARHIEHLKKETERLQNELDMDRKMIGDSPAMKSVRTFIARAAPVTSTVLIRGGSGTGKELVARAIHQNSPRANKPFIAINCAALPENLIESELFGHEKGAFTGAISQKKGKFELADGGTIFLDEVGELKPDLQAKLLRVLQESELERVGGTRIIKLNVRVIAATNKDLETAIRIGEFREDLYYRLRVLSVTMPSLKERQGDILQLAGYFLKKYAEECKRPIKGISDLARLYLQNYHWPGNVRELENVLERAVVMAESEIIEHSDLPAEILEYEPAQNHSVPKTQDTSSPTAPRIFEVTTFHEAVKEAKKQIILNAFEQAGGNHSGAAKLLGIHSNNLHRLISNLNLKPLLKKES
ncbi:MAG: sigma 54-interacting transcriptional regulator [Acidobacteria bacterium]|nr:sigma 54-interacting transcriptional regulator [Acidobacteriota bacterium]